MGKRGRPKKITEPLRRIVDETLEDRLVGKNDEVTVEGIPPTQFDVEEELKELGGRKSDPFYGETARFGRNADDPMGGIGLNFGDW